MPELSEAKVTALNQRAHSVFDSWASDHADGSVLNTRDYDPYESYQRVEAARMEPQPELDLASFLGKTGMGEAAFDKLSDGFRERRFIEKSLDYHRIGKSTLVTTLHLRNVLDTAMTHNNLFVTAGGDPAVAEINDIIANPMMSRLTIGSIAVYRVLTASGGVDNALPTEAAAQYGLPEADIQTLEQIYTLNLIERLKRGSIFHWSLPGTRGKKTENGTWYIKRVPDGIANIARKRFDEVLPVPMDVHFEKTQLEVLEPRRLGSVNDVHKMMEEMVEVASDLTGEKVSYGNPR